MATDQEIRDAGYKFISNQKYLQNPFVIPTPEITQQTTQGSGIPYTNAFTNAGGGGGGGGYGLFGDLDESTEKTFLNKNVWDGTGWVNTPVKGYKTSTGWKTYEGKNIDHAGINVQPLFASLLGIDKKGPQIRDIEGTFTHGWDSGVDKIKEGWDDEKDKWSGIFGIDKAKAFFKGKKDKEYIDEKVDDTDPADVGTTTTTTDQNQTGDGGGIDLNPSTDRDRGESREEGETGKIEGGHHFRSGGRAGFFKGALADTKEGKAMSPGTSATGEFRGGDEPTTGGDNTNVIPPKDNFTVDTDFLTTEPSMELNYTPSQWAQIMARLSNQDITKQDDINLEGEFTGGNNLIDYGIDFTGEGITGSHVGLGPFEANIDPNKNIENISFDQNIGDFNFQGNTDLENYNLGATYQPNDWLTAGATVDNLGNKNFNIGAKWEFGQPERTSNALSYQDQNPDLILSNMKYGGLVGIL